MHNAQVDKIFYVELNHKMHDHTTRKIFARHDMQRKIVFQRFSFSFILVGMTALEHLKKEI
jgi:hypothetical protein